MGLARRLTLGLVLVLGASRMIFYLAYASFALAAPFETFHLEAKMVLLAERVREGLSLYPSWSDYPHVSNFFGPLYFTIVGLLGRASGADIAGMFTIGRALTFASALATTFGLAWYLARKYGREAAVAGAVISLGAGPMLGFSVMVRPDIMAETLGITGFFLGGLKSRWGCALGCVVLVAAILTKQTAAIFLVALGISLFLEGDRRRAIAVVLGGSAGLAAVVAAVTILAEPNFARDLLGESKSPSDFLTWYYTLQRALLFSSDLIVFPVIGLILWTVRRPRDVRLATLTVVILATSLAASSKRGADLNYYLNLHLVEALAVGALWNAAETVTTRRGRALTTLAAALGLVALMPGTLFAWSQAYGSWTTAAALRGPLGEHINRTYQHVFRIAEDPKGRLLTDSGLFDLHQKGRAAFGDPWLFRMLVETGRVQPTRMRRSIDAEEYDLIVTLNDLNSPDYASYAFGLPMVLVEAARAHYAFVRSDAGLFFYTRRGLAPSRTGASPGDRIP